MAASADATDKAIQDALEALKGQQPSSGGDDAGIQDAMSALDSFNNPPKPRYTPDKGPAEFLSAGSLEGPDLGTLKRAAGGVAGAFGQASKALTFLPAGFNFMVGAPFGRGQEFFDRTVNLLDPAYWASDMEGPKGDFHEGLDAPGEGINWLLSHGVEAAGNVAASMTDPRLQRPAGLAGLPSQADMARALPKPTTPQNPEQGRVQAARTEAMTRSGTEAITQAVLALAGLKGGEGIVDQSGKASRETSSQVTSEDVAAKVQPGTSPGTSTTAQPTTDFAERMAAAAPKPVPKPGNGEPAPNPELEALAGQYRATPADVPATLPQLPKYLKGAKPKMGEQAITFASDLDKAAYIVANPRTASARHADYLEWLAKAMDTDENTALFMAKRSRDATVASVKAGKADVPPFLAPKRGPGQAAITAEPQAATASTSPLEQRMSAVDEALKGTALSRVNIPIGAEGFAQVNHLRMGQGEGTPLGYTQFVQDVYEHPADEVLQAIGEIVFQQGGGDPLRTHLDAQQLTALQQALAARGWNPARRDRLEMLSAAYDYAMRNRQVRNEGYARMRGAIQDNDLMGEMLRSPENFAVRVRLPKFDAGRDFEKVCSP